jgi:hypothetical protein
MAMTDCGVLYVVVGGRERYTEAAVRSAESLRRVMPGVSIAVASDRAIDGPFDQFIPLSEEDGFRAKIIGAAQTPFERTVILDVDTYVLTDFSDVFKLLDRFDVALAHAPNRLTLALDDVPVSFPEFNTGVIVYRRTDPVFALLSDWLREYDALSELDPPSKDQPAFRRAAYRASGLQIAALAPEFNLRFEMAGVINQPVRILHGWESEAGYRRVAEAMKTPPADWSYRAVFAGGRVYDRQGKRVSDFIAVPPGRVRSFKRRVHNRMLRLRGAAEH